MLRPLMLRLGRGALAAGLATATSASMSRTSPSFRFAACDPAAPQTSDATEAPAAWADGAEGVPAPPSTLYEDPEYNANILTLWRGHIAAARDAFKRHDVDGAERELVSLCSVSSSMSHPHFWHLSEFEFKKSPQEAQPSLFRTHAKAHATHRGLHPLFSTCVSCFLPPTFPPLFFTCLYVFLLFLLYCFYFFAALRNRRSRRRPTSARAPVPLRRAF